MTIKEDLKTIILKDFDFALEKINGNKDLYEILYYFSAIHGVVRRVMNIEFDDELLYLFQILNWVHLQLNNRFNAIVAGNDKPITLNDNVIEELIKLLNNLYEEIKNDKDFDKTLKTLLKLSYTFTGNGYFLMEKGFLKL